MIITKNYVISSVLSKNRINNLKLQQNGLEFDISIYYNHSDENMYIDIYNKNHEIYLAQGRKITPNINILEFSKPKLNLFDINIGFAVLDTNFNFENLDVSFETLVSKNENTLIYFEYVEE